MNANNKAKIEPDFNRASSLWHEGKLLEAARIFKGLDKKFPNQPAILGMLGAIYFTTGNYANALTYWEKVVKLSPKSELASRALFHTLLQHERFDDALTEANRFIKLNGYSKEYAMIMEELDENGAFNRPR